MSGGKLPEGWVKSELDNILLTIIGGGTPSKAIPEYYQGDIPWMSVKDMNKHTLTDTIDHITNDAVENSSTNIIPAGTPIIATRMSLGKIVTASFDSAINQDLKALFLSSGVDRDFFIHWYRSQAQLIESLGTGTTVKGIRLEVLKALSINLPPFFEQKIIAEKLDTLLAQVESTKARLEQIPQILKRFRQAVMKLAITGELTSEYRNNFPTNLVQDIAGIVEKERIEKKIKNSKLSKEPYPAKIPFSIPKSWQWYRLGHISLKITDGAHNTPKVLSEGYPYIMAKDLTKGKLDFSEKRFISEKDHKELYLKCIPEVGDLLVVNIGAGTGNNVLIDSEIEFSFKNIAIIKKSRLITPTYLKIFFDSQKNRIFNEQTKGGAQPFLSLSVLNDIPFALPPLPEQHEIVRRVEQLFAYADTIEKQVNNALNRVNSLTQSILAKAFRGELTAQWRAENPELISGENSAAALLEKIKAERAASGGKKTARKKA
ncbi:restriction endonuclease subunit S [Cronobacter sakazakii]|uniref:restriction endonuclease subunit S n=1 Tax=Cronobacter sakazakii TaxID=28141 RepID=UPI000978CB85|nr:restriction endonuclease subunit S [Cronobacter sakazakii]EGT5701536.1 restriction endonuclease subunit S [Cronobacter sakazakii]EJG0828593.1 restriction endonuclease subunit S [Cronobacter sakazakii]EME1930773.1 restriction endonuclease subunit S [Cronobacter sakazakii]EME1934277.1 restriction endonuclease subunit S [Cronobacter sakazakii]EME1944870.1 restriction endonuclease subunit S [Cronobacter sakazakii]